MKVRVVSDLHLEFISQDQIIELGNGISHYPADVLVLAGDVCPLKSKRWKGFIRAAARGFDHIIWVAGNHEYYGSNYKMARHYHGMRLDNFEVPVHFLHNQNVVIDNVNFIGSTLWTDFQNRNPLVMNDSQRLMNDFYRIKLGSRAITANDVLGIHETSKRWLFSEVRRGTARGNINFVVTHHGPSYESIHPNYRSGQWACTNGAYVSELSEGILSYDIFAWVHGHTHMYREYEIGDTKVLVNPKGYPGESTGWRFGKNIEVNNE